jgi:hypothetical protein
MILYITRIDREYDSSINFPFQFPDDSKNKLLFSLHIYTPSGFSMKPDISLSGFALDYKAELFDKFKNLY